MDRSKFVSTLREAMGAAPGDSGELTDITSRKRLELVYDMNVAEASEYGRWQADQDPDLLDAYPAQELVRIEGREEPRDWAERWAAEGGKFYAGRMIALKDDSIWRDISRFRRPWPPFDFGSGKGVEHVSREDAESLGVLPRGGRAPARQREAFNARLEATIPKATPGVLDGLKQTFGDQVDVDRSGKVTWQGQRILGLYDQALKDSNANWNLSLGRATGAATALAPELAGAELILKPSELKHVYDTHMVIEADGSQRRVTPIDLQLIPHVWRSPSAIVAGTQPGRLEFQAKLAGWNVLVGFDRSVAAGAAPGGAWGLKTFYTKREGVKP